MQFLVQDPGRRNTTYEFGRQQTPQQQARPGGAAAALPEEQNRGASIFGRFCHQYSSPGKTMWASSV